MPEPDRDMSSRERAMRPKRKPEYEAAITSAQPAGIQGSSISCQEVAKLVKNKRLTLTLSVLDWLNEERHPERRAGECDVRLYRGTPE